jgi:hypothetical protein
MGSAPVGFEIFCEVLDGVFKVGFVEDQVEHFL